MPNRKDCADLIKAQFPEFKKTTIDAIMDELDNMRSKVFSGTEDMKGPAFREKVMKFLDERRFQQAAIRREAAENILKNQKNLNFVMQDAFKGDPVEAVKAKLGGTAQYSEGGNNSVGATTVSMARKFLGQLWYGLEKAGDGATEIARKGLMDKDVAQALWKLDRGEDVSGVDKRALDIAKVYKAVNDSVLTSKQQAGSAVRRLTGYITKQSHDAAKIMADGFDKWYLGTIDKLDLDRTFGQGASEEKMRGAMEAVFKDIVSGKYDLPAPDKVSDEFMTVNGRSANLSKQTSQSRSLHFKDGHSWFDYNQAYGSKNLLESMVSSTQQSARQAALMYHFGTNPEGAYQALKSRIRSAYKDDPKVLKSFSESEGTLDSWFKEAQGFSSAPGTSLKARAGQIARAGVSMARTGTSFLSSFGDLPAALATLRGANGKNLFENMGSLVSEYVSNFGSSAERQKWAKRLGIYLDDFQGAAYAKMGAGEGGPGTLTQMQRLFSKATLMENHIQSSKVAMAKQLSMDLADRVTSPLESQPARVQANLTRYGIGAEEWKHLGRAVEDLGGVEGVTPEALRAVPAELFGEGGDRAKFATEVKLLNYLNDQADMAANHPGLRQRATLLRGMEDEGVGIMARLVTQFKSVPFMALDTFRRTALSNPEKMPRTLREAILKGKGDISGMVQLMVMGTAAGYASMAAKEFASGKTPPDPNHLKTWEEALVKGGAAGMYGDFLFGEFNRKRSAADAILGPALGEGATLADVWSKFRAGDKVGGDVTNLLMSNVPFQNVFYTKGALDYLIKDRVQEALSPGSMRRREGNAHKEGQDYLFYRPTEAVR